MSTPEQKTFKEKGLAFIPVSPQAPYPNTYPPFMRRADGSIDEWCVASEGRKGYWRKKAHREMRLLEQLSEGLRE